ncbi:MAG: hypothetical protein WBX25_34260 [Rhodomicrobium sp.]
MKLLSRFKESFDQWCRTYIVDECPEARVSAFNPSRTYDHFDLPGPVRSFSPFGITALGSSSPEPDIGDCARTVGRAREASGSSPGQRREDFGSGSTVASKTAS